MQTAARSRQRSGRLALAIALAAVSVLSLSCSSDSARAEVAADDRSGGEAEGTTDTPTDAADERSGGDAGSSEPGLLYALSAPSGSIDASTISLDDPDGRVTVFTDRPARSASRMSLEDFVDGWSDAGFDQDPPNASLTAELDGEERTFVVELRDPSIDGATVTFSYRPVGDAPDLAPGTPLVRPDLFIDDGSPGSSRAATYADPDGSTLDLSLVDFGADFLQVRVAPQPAQTLYRDGGITAFQDQSIVVALVSSDTPVDLADVDSVRSALATALQDDSSAAAASATEPKCLLDEGCTVTLHPQIEPGQTYTVLATAVPTNSSGPVDTSTQMVSAVSFST